MLRLSHFQEAGNVNFLNAKISVAEEACVSLVPTINNQNSVYGTCTVSGTVPSCLCEFSHLIISVTIGDGHYYDTHFIDEKTKAQRGPQ